MLKTFLSRLCLLITLLGAVCAHAASTVAPDSNQTGPNQVSSGEYKFPAAIDPDVMPGIATEVWAKMYYPTNIESSQDKHPVIVMLHGGHNTCGQIVNGQRIDSNNDYATTGQCPAGFTVTPNHEGYDYLANNLASWGYVVISINTNRGINAQLPYRDNAQMLGRGNLILKHLSLLYQWSTTGNMPTSVGLGKDSLIGKLDFSQVGLFGHSNGGEGVRVAYNLYQQPNNPWLQKIPSLKIKGIFEIGGVDEPIKMPGETQKRFLNADNIPWGQIIPLCDGEVSELGGRMPFERMMLNSQEPAASQKSVYEVWGANHDFFNTEWQQSDSFSASCKKPIFEDRASGSVKQQDIALATVPAFFRANVSEHTDATMNENFNPLYALPQSVTAITQVDRDFTPSPASSENLIVDDFNQKTGISSGGFPDVINQVTVTNQLLDKDYAEEHRTKQHTAVVSWLAASENTYFEAVLGNQGQGSDVHEYATLDFRTARTEPALNPDPTTDFSVMLEDSTGHFSNKLPISDFIINNSADHSVTDGPSPSDVHYIPILKTVRIPVSAFTGIDLTHVHGVKFVFDKTTTGSIYLTNIRFQRNIG